MRQKNYNRESELRKNRSKAYFCVEILDQAIKWKLFILEDPRAIPFLADHSNTRLININNREIEKVVKACCGYQSRSILKIKPLSDDLSKELFGNIVFGSGKGCSQQFNGISDEIINKCAGLPLALISIANLLASRREALENWKYVQFFLHENLRKNPTFEEIMKQVLNLCYSSLPHCLKTCLLYFSIYPENYIILKEDLVRQWVAEGFIYAKKGEDIMDVATIYFDRLVNLGLIQCMDINDNDKKLCYAVHHMVFDLITSKATENNFVTIINYFQTTAELSEKVRRLSLHFGSATYATVPAGIGLSQITCNVTVRLPTQMQCLTQLETFEINARVESVPSDIFHVPKLLHLCLRGGANFPNKKSFALDLGASGRVISLMGWSEMFCLFLQILEILPPICMFSRLPEWIARLHKLCTLKIVVKEFLKNDIDILTGLPALSILSLHVWQPTTERIIFHRAAFPALRCFKLWCGELYLVFQEEALPNLQRLKIGFNAHRGERYGNMLEGIENMLNLQTVDARFAAAAGAEESDRSAAEFAVMNAISKHSALTSFIIRRVDRVDEMVPQCPDLSADSSHPDPLQSDSTPNMTSESCISGVTSNPRLLDLVLSSSHHLEPDSLPTMTSEACTSEVTNLQESKPGTDHQRCRHPGCSKLARGSSGHCVAHGGGKRCQKTDCNKLLKGRIDFCKAHGGARVRCKHPGCRKNAVAGRTDFCIAHGGGKRKSRATVSGGSDVATSSKVTEGSMEGTTKQEHYLSATDGSYEETEKAQGMKFTQAGMDTTGAGFAIRKRNGDFPCMRRLCLVVQNPNLPTVEKGALPHVIQSNCSEIKIEYRDYLEEVSPDSMVNIKTIEIWENEAKKHPNRPKVMFLKSVDIQPTASPW
uniref:NB-ARC domain-containing protein n=1 Tax=Oryza glumipatula TaxID=40148 RepID=A0A0E0BGW2_9ORYZ